MKRVTLIISESRQSLQTLKIFLNAEKSSTIEIAQVVLLKKSMRNTLNFNYVKLVMKNKGFFYAVQLFFVKILLIVERRLFVFLVGEKKRDNSKILAKVVKKTYCVSSFSSIDQAYIEKTDVVVVHTSKFLSGKVLNFWDAPIIGAHPGPVSKYRGSHSVIWAFFNKDFGHIGFSIFNLTNLVDGGHIYKEKLLKIHKKRSFIYINELLNIYSYREIIKLIRSDTIFDKTLPNNSNLGGVYSYPNLPVIICSIWHKFFIK